MRHENEDLEYPPEDWMYETACGYTKLGYEEWVEHKKESEKQQ